MNRLVSIVGVVLLLSLSSCGRNKEEMAQLQEVGERAEQSYRQYRTADYATAKDALLNYIRYLEAKMADPSFVHVESSKADIMINYARLARLEEKNNGPDRELYMQKAIAMCEQMNVKRGCSPVDLEAQVDATDLMLQIK